MKVCDLYVIVMGLITKDDATILKKDIALPVYLFFYVYRFFAWRLLEKEESALKKLVF